MRLARLISALATLVAIGCGDKNTSKAPTAEIAQPTKIADDGSVPDDVKPTEVEDTDTAAKSVLAAWLDAQNRGDFDGYKALYSPSFRGVRKSGKKRVELGREAWFKDRARMFTKKMSVEADALKLSRAADLAAIEFVQTWRSGTYADIGEKRIELRNESGRSLIVSEEMLTSEKLITKVAVVVPKTFYRVDANRFAIPLGEARTNLKFAHRGEPRLMIQKGRASPAIERVEREVITSSLPVALQKLIGEKVSVFSSDGKSCQTTIVRFLENRTETTTAMFLERRNTMLSGGDHSALAAEIWPEVGAGPLMFETDSAASCDGLWASKLGGSTPVIGVEKPDPALEKLARRALTQTKDYARSVELEDEKWAVEHEAGEPAESRERYRDDWKADLKIEVRVFGASGAATLAVLTWSGGRRLVFRVSKAGKLTRLDPAEDYCRGQTQAAVDLNGDGTLDILAAVTRGWAPIGETCPALIVGDELKSVWQTTVY